MLNSIKWIRMISIDNYQGICLPKVLTILNNIKCKKSTINKLTPTSKNSNSNRTKLNRIKFMHKEWITKLHLLAIQLNQLKTIDSKIPTPLQNKEIILPKISTKMCSRWFQRWRHKKWDEWLQQTLTRKICNMLKEI